jgi:hypothetical protein
MRCLFAMALALLLLACASVPMFTGAVATPDGPISIIYRDDASNERNLNGVAHYGAVLGRDRSVSFTVNNQRAESVCNGTFTRDGPNGGKFTLSCLGGSSSAFRANGSYERETGDPNDRLTAHGQTSRGFPITLVVGRHS